MLQPFHVLRAEVTAINKLYWLHCYSSSRTLSILRAISAAGHATEDPAVHDVWPSLIDGERRNITVPLSELSSELQRGRERLRSTSVLYVCSAFETYLKNLFGLCALYKPDPIYSPGYWKWGRVPQLLQRPTDVQRLKKRALKEAGKRLWGKYSQRVAVLLQHFSTTATGSLGAPSSLDNWYKTRHRIAHDQSLLDPAKPDQHAKAVLLDRVVVSEDDWKSMLGDFHTTARLLNDDIIANLVTDHGLAVALGQELRAAATNKFGELSLGRVRRKIIDNWKLDVSMDEVAQLVPQLGFALRRSRGGRGRYLAVKA